MGSPLPGSLLMGLAHRRPPMVSTGGGPSPSRHPGPVAAGVAAGVARPAEEVTRPVAADKHGQCGNATQGQRTGQARGGETDQLLSQLGAPGPADGEVFSRLNLDPSKAPPVKSRGLPPFTKLSSRVNGTALRSVMRERDSDVLGSVRTERRVCHRRNPSAGVPPAAGCGEHCEDEHSAGVDHCTLIPARADSFAQTTHSAAEAGSRETELRLSGLLVRESERSLALFARLRPVARAVCTVTRAVCAVTRAVCTVTRAVCTVARAVCADGAVARAVFTRSTHGCIVRG
eukprot:scaffold1580_cov58-Phaeocystis_antarctica.AAC.3